MISSVGNFVSTQAYNLSLLTYQSLCHAQTMLMCHAHAHADLIRIDVSINPVVSYEEAHVNEEFNPIPSSLDVNSSTGRRGGRLNLISTLT